MDVGYIINNGYPPYHIQVYMVLFGEQQATECLQEKSEIREIAFFQAKYRINYNLLFIFVHFLFLF